MDLATIFAPENWPIGLVCVVLITAAVIDFWKLKVPNWLTFPMILTGWVYGFIAFWVSGESVWDGLSGLWAALVLTFFGLALLLPVYAIGGMGAGDVKMQMGFGSWVGAIYGLSEGFWIVLYGFFLAALVGGVIAFVMMWVRGDFRRNRQNVKEIVGDWVKSASVEEVAAKAAQRKPRMHLLPYGVPLCIGFIGYLVIRNWQILA